MLSANTVWLEPNMTLAPMNNLNFRKAVAYAINPAQIVASSTTTSSTRRTRPDCSPTSTRSSARACSSSTGSATPEVGEAVPEGVELQGPEHHYSGPGRLDDWNTATQVIVQDLLPSESRRLRLPGVRGT